MEIYFEDKHYIIVNKPPKVPSQSDPTGDLDLCTMVRTYISKRDHVKKRPLYVVHRLDRPVGGLITFAKTQKAADLFSQMIKERSLKKTYLCVAYGQAKEGTTQLTHYLKKKSGQNVSIAVHKNNEGAKEARLSYTSLESIKVKRDQLNLLKVHLETGRHHQIRVQLSAAELPLWGDAKYHPQAKRKRNWTQIALWSFELSFIHPFTKEKISLQSKPPAIEPWTQFESILMAL